MWRLDMASHRILIQNMNWRHPPQFKKINTIIKYNFHLFYHVLPWPLVSNSIKHICSRHVAQLNMYDYHVLSQNMTSCQYKLIIYSENAYIQWQVKISSPKVPDTTVLCGRMSWFTERGECPLPISKQTCYI